MHFGPPLPIKRAPSYYFGVSNISAIHSLPCTKIIWSTSELQSDLHIITIYIYICIFKSYHVCALFPYVPLYRPETSAVIDLKDRIILSGGLFQIFTATRPKLCTFFMLTTLATQICKAFKARYVTGLGKSPRLILDTPKRIYMIPTYYCTYMCNTVRLWASPHWIIEQWLLTDVSYEGGMGWSNHHFAALWQPQFL